MSQLRDYQLKMKQETYAMWQQHRNILQVLATGGGKTFLFTDIMKDFRAPIAIAHRKELVGQMSLTLGMQGIYHRIIAPNSTVREIVKLHMRELGESFYNPNAPASCAGVDTLINKDLSWFGNVDLLICDEAHHLLRENKWGKSVDLFPNARVLGVTATPVRADGKGLGSHAQGVFDAMVEGPTGRELIELGSLCDYDIACPTLSIDRNSMHTAASGDFSPAQLKIASRGSPIVGDVVQSYMKLARGKLGVTFAPTIEVANDLMGQFIAAGIPAQVVTAKTGALERAQILLKHKNSELLQLINVDLFGEGFDLPALEVVSMARPTESYALYAQQFGRALRPMPGKDKALIIDHVGNVVRHGLPDGKKQWSLDARERRGSNHPSDGEVPMRVCPECTAPYPRILIACEFCNHVPKPAKRSAPEYVDGDLELLDAQALAKLRGEVSRVDNVVRIPESATPVIAASIRKRHNLRQEAQVSLRESISQWAGYRTAEGLGIREAQKFFYLTFGTDVMSAQTLGVPEAEKLKKVIDEAVSSGA